MPGHPAIVVGRAHKKRVEDWLCSVFEDACGPDHARQLARQVILLLDGSFSVVLLHRDPSYMETAGEAAASLIRGLFPEANGKRVATRSLEPKPRSSRAKLG